LNAILYNYSGNSSFFFLTLKTIVPPLSVFPSFGADLFSEVDESLFPHDDAKIVRQPPALLSAGGSPALDLHSSTVISLFRSSPRRFSSDSPAISFATDPPPPSPALSPTCSFFCERIPASSAKYFYRFSQRASRAPAIGTIHGVEPKAMIFVFFFRSAPFFHIEEGTPWQANRCKFLSFDPFSLDGTFATFQQPFQRRIFPFRSGFPKQFELIQPFFLVQFY